MTLKRRVAAIEASLSPTQLVLRWLAEAHACGSLEAYVGSILDLPGEQQPIDRLCREAQDGARARLRGKPAEQVRLAVNSALRETVFRYELVLRIYVTAHELLDREALIDAALSAHVALLTSIDEKARLADATYAERFATCRDLLAFRISELRAAQEARALVESRYLDGHAALFPDVAAAWDEQVRSTESIADMAARLGELDGVPPAGPPDPETLSRRTAELMADLVEPAKADALEKLGEGRQALGIAAGWVRARLTPQTDVTSDVAPPDAP
ncbi:MAG: hypothetical protein ABSD62_15310 [Candidatus Limnocylindrales bacterium]|jgi:hypothetical protein